MKKHQNEADSDDGNRPATVGTKRAGGQGQCVTESSPSGTKLWNLYLLVPKKLCLFTGYVILRKFLKFSKFLHPKNENKDGTFIMGLFC